MCPDKPEESFTYSSDVLESFVDCGVGVIYLKDKIFEMAVDLSLKQILFDRLAISHKSDDIKVVLLISNPSVLGEEKNEQFWRTIREFSPAISEKTHFKDCDDARMIISREENSINQFIFFALRHTKFIISALRGSVVEPFLGAALASDYRIIGEDTVFSFPHFRHGMPPRGGLTYFLPMYVGMGRAKEILFRGKPIDAAEAKNLGLVNEVLPNESFNERCLKIAGEFASLPVGVVAKTKSLFGCDLTSLEELLKKELTLLEYIRMA